MASIRNDLGLFFKPRHIAIVGVARSESSFGGLSFLQKLQEARFPGTLYCINPKATEIRGFRPIQISLLYPWYPILPWFALLQHKSQLFWRNAAGSAYGTFIS
jgi:hypothetical protein